MIRIKTPSRLHLGLMDLNGESGRLYGSVGVALEKPNIVIEAERDPAIPEEIGGLANHYGLREGMKYYLKNSIPEHSGLGSGTQLSLALATAYTTLYDIKASPRELAEVLGLGKVSGIGIAAFEKGGFIVDCGVSKCDPKPPVAVFQQPFPVDWFFVLAMPEIGKGFYGEKEKDAFREAVPGPKKLADEITRLVHNCLIPAFKEKDIESFGRNLTLLDEKTGEWFRKAQGGVHRSSEVIEAMKDLGALGVGQSSWGPACYALVKEDDASLFESELRERIAGTFFSTRASNKGAEVTVN